MRNVILFVLCSFINVASCETVLLVNVCVFVFVVWLCECDPKNLYSTVGAGIFYIFLVMLLFFFSFFLIFEKLK